MPALVIAGNTVEVQSAGSPKQNQGVRIGETARAYDGTLRSTVQAVKRLWTFTTPPLSDADYRTLVASIGLGIVTVSGDLLAGDTFAADVEITGAVPIKDLTQPLDFSWLVTFDIREV